MTINDIIRRAARMSGQTVESIVSPSRRPMHVKPRFAVAWVARRRGHSFAQIGRRLNRDHTTILDAVKRAEEMRASDRFFRDMTDALVSA